MANNINNNATGGGDNVATSYYKECQRNHAPHLGLYTVDGCREFCRSWPDDQLCNACGCHKNFHRRFDQAAPLPLLVAGSVPIFLPAALMSSPLSSQLPQLPPPSQQQQQMRRRHPVVAPQGGGSDNGEATHGGEDGDVEVELVITPTPMTRKSTRVRTKYTTLQKEGMREFAENLGWMTNGQQREDQIRVFSEEIGITPQNFKVWVKNNKKLGGLAHDDAGSSSKKPKA